uniref:Uncharacterized protein n=1 Tax=Photinus pyralis TaxID=7054 RepID=A0A1Y1M026_PHOPY
MKGSVPLCVLFAIFLRSIHNSQIGIGVSSRSLEVCGAKAVETIFGKQPLYFVYHNMSNHLLPFHVSNSKILVNTSTEKRRLRWPFYNFVIQSAKLYNERFLVVTDENDLAKASLKWFWQRNAIYAAVLSIDLHSCSKSLLFTANPNDPLNACGRQLNVIHNQSCSGSITDTIPKPFRNYNGCLSIIVNFIQFRYHYDPRDYTLNVTRELLNISMVIIVDYNLPEWAILGDMSLTIDVFHDYRVSHVFARDNIVFVVPPADKISYIEVLV